MNWIKTQIRLLINPLKRQCCRCPSGFSPDMDPGLMLRSGSPQMQFHSCVINRVCVFKSLRVFEHHVDCRRRKWNDKLMTRLFIWSNFLTIISMFAVVCQHQSCETKMFSDLLSCCSSLRENSGERGFSLWVEPCRLTELPTVHSVDA